jgi:RNA polymerase sigma factor (sigma-70 family)
MRVEILADETPTSLIRQEFSIYRRTTVAFLRKFLRMSMELGHLPSLLGREFFRTHVTSYTTYTFEDAVIFTHDVERCLESLPQRLQEILGYIVMQEYTQPETARLMGISQRTVERWYAEALDRMAEVCVRHGLLKPIAIAQNPCLFDPVEIGPAENEKEDDTRQDPCSLLPPKKPVSSVQSRSGLSLRLSKTCCG